jgi:hypothetical protein
VLALSFEGQHVFAAGLAADVPVVLDMQHSKGGHFRWEVSDRVLTAVFQGHEGFECGCDSLGDRLFAMGGGQISENHDGVPLNNGHEHEKVFVLLAATGGLLQSDDSIHDGLSN